MEGEEEIEGEEEKEEEEELNYNKSEQTANRHTQHNPVDITHSHSYTRLYCTNCVLGRVEKRRGVIINDQLNLEKYVAYIQYI